MLTQSAQVWQEEELLTPVPPHAVLQAQAELKADA